MSSVRSNLHRALQHPLRRDVLAYLQEHGTGSPSEIASTLEVSVQHLSYHVRRLAQLGLIEQVHTTRGRGGMLHVYGVTQAFRESIAMMLSEEIVRLAAVAYPDIGPSAVAMLDEQALGELSHDMEHLFARVGELRAQTVARAARSRTPLPTVATAVLFAVGDRT
jgi:predicted ArsR family transcriptional regulator